MGYALRRGDHIRVTLILQRLHGRTRWWMEVVCLVVATLLTGYFAWFTARLVWGSYTYNDISQNVDATPLWIPQLSMALGLSASRSRSSSSWSSCCARGRCRRRRAERRTSE